MSDGDRIWWDYFQGNPSWGLVPQWTYRAIVKHGDKPYPPIHTELGYVRKRKDGRFDWFVRPTRARTDWPVKKHAQGVASTLEEAGKKVEGFWRAE